MSECGRMRDMSYGQAINAALVEEMERDERVFVAGEGVGIGIHANPHLPTHGLLDRFGRGRVKDTPVSEAAIAGLAVGSAAMGLRPVVEIMFSPFLTIASDMIVNHAAKLHYLSGGKTSFPLVIRVKVGAGFCAGCQHSHNLEAWLAHTPGLKVIMPFTAADAKGLLTSAMRDPNPVVFMEDTTLYGRSGPVPQDSVPVPIGKVRVARQGSDITIASWSKMAGVALSAAEQLQNYNIACEVLDLRTLLPLDVPAILQSVGRTGRLIVLHEATRTGGFGAEVAALVAEECFSSLKAPVRRIAAPDIPVPFSPPLERFYIPRVEQVVEAARQLVGR
jgi:pyruvate/2-oxoglutarate/acetoin dehydrogenase E1 component